MSELPLHHEAGVVPRMIFTLGLAGLAAGLGIVLVHLFTLPLIEANRAAATRAAVLKVVPDSTQMQKLQVVRILLLPRIYSLNWRSLPLNWMVWSWRRLSPVSTMTTVLSCQSTPALVALSPRTGRKC